MLTDVVVDPFGADVGEMVDVAGVAERSGISAVWVTDHFSGAVVGAPWSRDPFVCLGAMAAATARIGLGVLVANIVNRHPAQLASAVDSLQSLAPGRVHLGVGSGAAPGSRFAVEHEAIGRTLDDPATRRQRLVDYIGALRAIWAGERSFAAQAVGFDGLTGVVDGTDAPPVIVGGSAWSTIEVATQFADGVNIRRTAELTDQLERLAATDTIPGFEISVLDDRDDLLDPEVLRQAGVHRRIVTVSPPFDHVQLEALITEV